MTEGSEKGWLKETAGLKPTKAGTRIRSKGGKLSVTNRFMELHRLHIPDFECESEVRPFDDM